MAQLYQTEIDFNAIHFAENNPESQKFYDENKAHFSNQCKKVLDLLKSGKRLQVLQTAIDHKIMHLPRRIKDLKDCGIEIQSERVTGGIVEYYL